MSDATKTQHDFNLAVVAAVRVMQGQIGDLQARAATLEEAEQARTVESVADALQALAEAMPEPAPVEEQQLAA